MIIHTYPSTKKNARDYCAHHEREALAPCVTEALPPNRSRALRHDKCYRAVGGVWDAEVSLRHNRCYRKKEGIEGWFNLKSA